MFANKITVTDNQEGTAITKLAKELVDLGYKTMSFIDEKQINKETNFRPEKLSTDGQYIYLYASRTDGMKEGHGGYEFDLDEEYDLALAIASQRTGGMVHVGEWVKHNSNSMAMPWTGIKKVAALRNNYTGDDAFNSEEYHNNRNSPNSWESNFPAYNIRATAEEIIEHFRKNKIKEMKKVAIYEDYSVWCETLEEAQELVKYQEELFGRASSAQSNHAYRINPSRSPYDQYGYSETKGWYLENGYGIKKELSFTEWKEMIAYKKYKEKTNMENKEIGLI